MKASRTLAIAPFLLLSACTIYVEDPEPAVPYWATTEYKINEMRNRSNTSVNQSDQINQGYTIVTENKTYKLSVDISKNEVKDIKISLYLVACEDNKTIDNCSKTPINQSIDLSYTLIDGYTGDILETKTVPTSYSTYVIHTKNNYPECLNVTVNNSKNISIKSQSLNFNETKAVGC